MAKTTKVPFGFEARKIILREVSEGARPSLQVHPADYLPIAHIDGVPYVDNHHELNVALEAGRIVALDQTSLNTGAVDNKRWLVWANGAEAGGSTVTYAAADVDEVYDIDEYDSGNTTLLAASGAASKKIAANIPLGFAPYNYIHKAVETKHHNTFPQPNVAVLTRYMIELPLLYDSGDGSTTVPSGQDQNTLDTGDLVKPGPLGWPVKFDPVIASSSDSLDQICGRVILRRAFGVKNALDKVHTVPGLTGLPGTGTDGRQLHENLFLRAGATGKVATKVQSLVLINICLL